MEGTQLESFTTGHGFHQLISQLTHLLPQTSPYISFYGYLLLLLLLYLYVVGIIYLLEHITVISVQRSTERCTGIVVVTSRG